MQLPLQRSRNFELLLWRAWTIKSQFVSYIKLSLCIPEIILPAPHSILVGYTTLPTCPPKLLGTRESPHRETDDNMSCDQPAKDIP